MIEKPFGEGKKKYLCICDAAVTRSYALATSLKIDFGREAISVGRYYISPDTMKMLCEWADIIVTAQEHMIESIEADYRHKVVCANMGEDVWGHKLAQDLYMKAGRIATWLVEKEKEEWKKEQ